MREKSDYMSNTDVRRLDWEGCRNVRDLGGLPTEDGRVTRWNAVVRADMPGRLTLRGREALLAYGIRTIIDLRAPHEAESDPSLFVGNGPHNSRPCYLNLPMEYFYPEVSQLISKAQSRADVYNIILDSYPDAIAKIMRALQSAQPGGILIHCHAGKDRTGTIAALLLSLAGVPEEDVVADYALSSFTVYPQPVLHNPDGSTQDDFWATRPGTPEVMQAMLAHLDQAYGGVRSYLMHAGVTADELDALVQRLVMPR